MKAVNGIDLANQKITNLADGTNPADAVLRGLDWKNSVKVATTANITLSGTQTIDGVAVVSGDRVLAKDETTVLYRNAQDLNGLGLHIIIPPYSGA